MQNSSYRNERAEDQNRSSSSIVATSEDVATSQPAEYTELNIFNKVSFLSVTLFTTPFLHLTVLNVQKNNLRTLPAEICKLQNLQKLNASDNLIVSIPPELGKCEQLRHVNFENNRITTIPYELGKLYNILEFNFNNNPLALEFATIYHGIHSTPQLQVELLNHCRGPCLITSRNCGKKSSNNYHPNQFTQNLILYQQWYSSLPPTPNAFLPPYQTNDSLETHFSRLSLQKHGVPLVLGRALAPPPFSIPNFVHPPNVLWKPRFGGYNGRFLPTKKKPNVQSNDTFDQNCLPRLTKKKKRKKRDKTLNKQKTNAIIVEGGGGNGDGGEDINRSYDFGSTIPSVDSGFSRANRSPSSSDGNSKIIDKNNNIDIGGGRGIGSGSSSGRGSGIYPKNVSENFVNCQCCFCEPSRELCNFKQLIDKSNSVSSFSLSSSKSTSSFGSVNTTNSSTIFSDLSSNKSRNENQKDFEQLQPRSQQQPQHETNQLRQFEVSSKIITAPNGHRDLEIRLHYSFQKP